MKKRLFLTLLAAFLLLAVLTVSAAAAETVADGYYNSCRWTLDSDGVLRFDESSDINGSPEDTENLPEGHWLHYRDQIRRVEIQSVQNISFYAFYGCKNLTRVEIASVNGISDFAFFGCESLTEVVLPASVFSVNADAFYGCAKLERITVTDREGDPSLYSSAGGVLFSNKGSRIEYYPAGKTETSYTIPGGVQDIQPGAFSQARHLTEFRVGEGNERYTVDEGGLLYSDEGHRLECYPAGRTARSFTIPDGVHDIAPRAFAGCASLEEVHIPADVFLQSDCFRYCSKLTDVYYAGTLSQWRDRISGLNLYGSFDIGEGIPSPMIHFADGEAAYHTLSFDANGGSGTMAPVKAIHGFRTRLPECTFAPPSNAQRFSCWRMDRDGDWRDYRPGDDTKDMTGDLTLLAVWEDRPKAVVNLRSDAESTQVELFDGDSYELPECPFAPVPGLEFKLWQFQEGLLAPGETITITGMCDIWAVYGKTYRPLATLDVGEIQCDTLLIPPGESVLISMHDFPSYLEPELADSTVASFTIADGMLTITAISAGETSFAFVDRQSGSPRCEKKFFIRVQDDLPQIVARGVCGWGQNDNERSRVKWILDGTGLLSFTTDPAFSSQMADFEPGQTPWQEYRDQITAVSVCDGVNHVGANAFQGFSRLSSVTIAERVDSIGEGAFKGCVNLSSVAFPEKEMSGIQEDAFAGCTKLTQITLPQRMDHIAPGAFRGSGLQTVVFPRETSQNIMENPFRDCSSLKSIVVGSAPDSGKPDFVSIDGVLFGDRGRCLVAYPAARPGTTYEVPAGVVDVLEDAFYGCTKLTAFTVEEGNSAFLAVDGVLLKDLGSPLGYDEGCILVAYPTGKTNSSYTLPARVKSIARNAFQSCTSLTSITFPGDVSIAIGAGIFQGCPNLASITFQGGANIGEGAFRDCTALTSVTFLEGDVFISADAFQGCTKLASVSFKDAGEIGDRAFQGCKALTSVTFLDEEAELFQSVHIIGYNAFQDCTGLTSLTFPGKVDTVRDSAFQGCTGLTSVTFGGGVNILGDKAFQDCSSLTTATLLRSWTYRIGRDAFKSCTSLTTITIPDDFVMEGADPFLGCTRLTDVYYGGSRLHWHEYADQCRSSGPEEAPINENYSFTLGPGIPDPTIHFARPDYPFQLTFESYDGDRTDSKEYEVALGTKFKMPDKPRLKPEGKELCAWKMWRDSDHTWFDLFLPGETINAAPVEKDDPHYVYLYALYGAPVPMDGPLKLEDLSSWNEYWGCDGLLRVHAGDTFTMSYEGQYEPFVVKPASSLTFTDEDGTLTFHAEASGMCVVLVTPAGQQHPTRAFAVLVEGELPKPEYAVTFDSQGGSTVAGQTVEGGSPAVEPSPIPEKAGSTFGGWYTDAACTAVYDFDQPVSCDLTLYAKWRKPARYTLSGKLVGHKQVTFTSLTVRLVASDGETYYFGTVGSGVPDHSGAKTDYPYRVSAPAGKYGLIVDGETSDGAKNSRTTMVELVGDQSLDVNLPSGQFKVKRNQDAPPVFASIPTDAVPDDPGSKQVDVILTVSAVPEANSDTTAIENAAGTDTEFNFLELSITKTVDGTQSAVTETDALLAIVVPFDSTGKKDVRVYRVHNGAAPEVLTTTENAAGEYIEVGPDSITIYTRRFSTYAIASSVEVSASACPIAIPYAAAHAAEGSGSTLTATLKNRGTEQKDLLVVAAAYDKGTGRMLSVQLQDVDNFAADEVDTLQFTFKEDIDTTAWKVFVQHPTTHAPLSNKSES